MKPIDLSQPASSHNPFIVPTDYFSQFTGRMMQRIAAQTELASRPEMPIVRWIPWLGAACVAALMALFSFFATPSSVKDQVSGVTSETAQAKTSSSQSNDMVYDYLMMANADNYVSYENDY